MIANRTHSTLLITLNATALVGAIFFSLVSAWYIVLLAGNILLVGLRMYSDFKFKKAVNKVVDRAEDDFPLEELIPIELSKYKVLSAELKTVTESINEIGQTNFVELIQDIQHTEIKTSLEAAHAKIISLRQKEEQTNWIIKGVALIAGLKNKSNDLSAYADQVISTVVKYLNVNQGSFFALKEGEKPCFELIGAYAYGKKKYISQTVPVGHGLIGQVYYEKELILRTDLPNDYLKITSGLGEALPGCVCIVPLVTEGILYGVIELASFQKLTSADVTFLKKISETVGFNLHSIENQANTQKLLGESQKMMNALKSGEEELRQNMEELTATQEEMKRKQIEMDALLASVSIVEMDVNGTIISANSIFTSITGHKAASIVGQPYKKLIPQNENDPSQFEIMLANILAGRSFSGEFRIMNASKKEMWMAGNFTPILNERGQPYKVMVISLFTTQDKEKLVELQVLVNAIKNIFPMAEISSDLHFKSANDLFLKALGIKRIELRKTLPSNVLSEISFIKLKQLNQADDEMTEEIEIDIPSNDGMDKTYESVLIKLNGATPKSVLILKSQKTLAAY
jgi:PAS domain S-box-containing protein